MERTTCICRQKREDVNTREKQRRSSLSRPEVCDDVVAMVPHQHFWNKDRRKCITKSMTARIVDFNRRHLKQGVLEEWLQAGGDSSCSPNEKKKKTNTRQRGRITGKRWATKASQGPACRNWLREFAPFFSLVNRGSARHHCERRLRIPSGKKTCP